MLGRTGVSVAVLGLGGEGILRTYGHDDEAYRLINAALDLGIDYFESARAYAGSEEYYGLALRERRKDIFLASKSHDRSRNGARRHLEETLRNFRTGHLDLWQIHDVRTREEVEEIFGPAGAVEAFVRAREQGLVRFLGVTGHHDPAVIRQCIERFDFDTVLMPVNPAEPKYRSFLNELMPVAFKKGMGIVGMKVYLRGLVARLPWYRGMEPFLRYALSQPVSLVVIGCDNVRQLSENVEIAGSFTPLTDKEQQALVDTLAPDACRLMYYKP